MALASARSWAAVRGLEVAFLAAGFFGAAFFFAVAFVAVFAVGFFAAGFFFVFVSALLMLLFLSESD